MSVAANRYAKALIDVLYPNSAEAGYEQLVVFRGVLQQQSDARRFFENPTISFERRKALARALGAKIGFDNRVTNFIDLLIERNRLDLLGEIIHAYQQYMDEKLGIVRAVITTTVPLNAAQKDRLTQKLSEVTGKKIRMETAIDASLIGGLVAQVGSTVYDGSIRQQLQGFKNTLSQR